MYVLNIYNKKLEKYERCVAFLITSGSREQGGRKRKRKELRYIVTYWYVRMGIF